MTHELTLILKISDRVESLKETIKKLLQKYGVTVISEDPWDVKKLAYPIDGESEGYYLFMSIDSPPNAIKQIISEFRLNTDILRYLFIKASEKASEKKTA
ncbi:MAG: 30S ribosomal protein S6 [Spirochaetes bacterium]|nr:30S ribosomal protein S6 [Spirochaetota bacterium]